MMDERSEEHPKNERINLQTYGNLTIFLESCIWDVAEGKMDPTTGQRLATMCRAQGVLLQQPERDGHSKTPHEEALDELADLF